MNENTAVNNMETILPLLLWLLSIIRCCGESTAELKSFHGNSAWEIVETSEYDGFIFINFFLILMCKQNYSLAKRKHVNAQQLKWNRNSGYLQGYNSFIVITVIWTKGNFLK